MNFGIGVDIGGSHISCAAIDMETEELLTATFSEAKVDNQAPSGIILEKWTETILSTVKKCGNHSIEGIGFAMPGPFDYVNGVALFEQVKKYESLFGINVQKKIRSILALEPEIPIRFINDATAFAVGECWTGKGKDSARLIALTLGTGFGSAFMEYGIPIVKGDTVPENGCLWHLSFGDGIADDYISTRWFGKEFQKRTGMHITGVKQLADFASYSKRARQLFSKYGENLGQLLLPAASKFNTEKIVIGGNITGAYEFFASSLEEKIKLAGEPIDIQISDLKENAAIIGAARLIQPQYWQNIKTLLQYM